jgi:transposase
VGVVDLRQLKALQIAACSRITFDGKTWLVPSQSGNGKYHVLLSKDGDGCECEDFQLHRVPCKHLLAVQIVRARDHGGKNPELDTSEVPKRPTYKQDWSAYNLAQRQEKARLLVLLHELCQGVEQPRQRAGKPGRKPTTLGEQAFACAFKIYSMFSSRRFGTDLDEAHAKGFLSRTLHPNKVNTFLESAALTPVLQELIVQSSLPLRTVETVFAPDSTGFSTSRFVRWYDEKYGLFRTGKAWVKAHAICGVKTNIVTAVEIHDQDAADCPLFKPLVEKTAEHFTVKEVPADKAYLSHENLALVDGLGGTAYIPFKSNSAENDGLWAKMFHYFQFRRDEFLQHYHQRSNAESTFSMVKAKFRDNVRAKTDVALKNEVLCKFLCHNICCVIAAHCELGIEPIFWQDGKEAASAPVVLPMVRPG